MDPLLGWSVLSATPREYRLAYEGAARPAIDQCDNLSAFQLTTDSHYSLRYLSPHALPGLVGGKLYSRYGQ
jgi:hypothetical protein